jgi:hypothetical protein
MQHENTENTKRKKTIVHRPIIDFDGISPFL